MNAISEYDECHDEDWLGEDDFEVPADGDSK